LIKLGLAERLKEIRIAMDYTQRQMASAIGLKLPSLQDYEQSKSVPGGNVIALLVDIGVDANWLLNGDGEMLRRIELSHAQEEIIKRFRSGYDGDIRCLPLAQARQEFVEQYQNPDSFTDEDISWLYEYEPKITLQQLIKWDNNFHAGEYPFDFPTGSSLKCSILRQATAEIEKISKECHLHLPLSVIGRIQELVIEKDLTLTGIKPTMMMINELIDEKG